MKILIIGANSCLSQQIITKINSIHPESEIVGIYHKNKQNLKADAIYRSVEDEYLNQKFYDAIFFIASHIPDDLNAPASELLIQANISLLEKTLEKFQFDRLIYASSVSVYGNSHDIITEHTLPAPQTAYAKSKLTGETICAQFEKHFNIRISSLVGDLTAKHSYINRAILQAKESGLIKVWGDGSRCQNYIDIEDCAKYFVACLGADQPGSYLAVADQSHSNKELASIIEARVPNSSIVFEGSDDSPSFHYDNSQTKSVLKVQNSTAIMESIDKLANAKG